MINLELNAALNCRGRAAERQENESRFKTLKRSLRSIDRDVRRAGA